VIITHSATIDFWIPLVKGAQDAAAMINAFDPTVKISVTHTGPSMFNVAEQVNIMENVIQAGVDGIISTLPDPPAFDEPARRAWPMWVRATMMPAAPWPGRSSTTSAPAAKWPSA